MTNNKLTDERIHEILLKFARDSYRLNGTETGMALGDAVFALRELQERRTTDKNYFMFGIATPEGDAYLEEFCVSSDRGLMEDEVAALNDTHDTDGYRVVALYTAIPLVDSERAELQERRKADSAELAADMNNIITLLENNEWAEHCTKTALGLRLESEITRLHSEKQSATPALEGPEGPNKCQCTDCLAASILVGDRGIDD